MSFSLLLKHVCEYVEGGKAKAGIKRLIVAIAGIIETAALICALIYCLQDAALFHPNSDPGSYQYISTRQEFNEISFEDGGKTYHGIIKVNSGAEPAPLIIMFIGNGQNAAQAMRAMDSAGIWESFLGYNCLIMLVSKEFSAQ